MMVVFNAINGGQWSLTMLESPSRWLTWSISCTTIMPEGMPSWSIHVVFAGARGQLRRWLYSRLVKSNNSVNAIYIWCDLLFLCLLRIPFCDAWGWNTLREIRVLKNRQACWLNFSQRPSWTKCPWTPRNGWLGACWDRCTGAWTS